jgi:hypothetical protein
MVEQRLSSCEITANPRLACHGEQLVSNPPRLNMASRPTHLSGLWTAEAVLSFLRCATSQRAHTACPQQESKGEHGERAKTAAHRTAEVGPAGRAPGPLGAQTDQARGPKGQAPPERGEGGRAARGARLWRSGYCLPHNNTDGRVD